MPSIGELFVSLGFKWDKQNLKELNENIQAVVEGLAKVTAGAGAAVGALGAFVQHAADTAVKLSNMRADFGASTQAAQTFANALHQINPAISVEEGLEKYRKFSELVKASIAQGKGGEATGALARLGVNWHENISVEEARQDIMKNRARTMAGLSPDQATAKAIYSDLLSAAGLSGTTKLFGENEGEYQAAARNNIKDEDIEKLDQFAQATAKLSEAFTKFNNNLAGELSEVLTPAVNRFVNALDAINSFNSGHSGAAMHQAILGSALFSTGAGKVLSKLLPRLAGLGSFTTGVGELVALGSIPWVASDAGTAIGEWIKRGRNTSAAYFERQGWSKEDAAAIMRTLQSESGMDPNIYGKGKEGRGMPEEAYGLAQWHPDRQAIFKQIMGHDIHGSTLEEQMAFVQYELTRGNEQRAGKSLRAAHGADAKFNALKFGAGSYERALEQNNTIYINSSENADSLARTMKREFQGQMDKAFSQTNLGPQ